MKRMLTWQNPFDNTVAYYEKLKNNYIIVILFLNYLCSPIKELKSSLNMSYNCKRKLLFKLNTIIVDHSEDLRIKIIH